MAVEKLRRHCRGACCYLVFALAALNAVRHQGVGLAEEGEARVIHPRIDKDLTQQEQGASPGAVGPALTQRQAQQLCDFRSIGCNGAKVQQSAVGIGQARVRGQRRAVAGNGFRAAAEPGVEVPLQHQQAGIARAGFKPLPKTAFRVRPVPQPLQRLPLQCPELGRPRVAGQLLFAGPQRARKVLVLEAAPDGINGRIVVTVLAGHVSGPLLCHGYQRG